MEATIDDWSKETVAQAQKDLEEQKIAWELQQQQKLAQDPSLNSNRLETEDDACATEDLLTYSRIDNLNQVKPTTKNKKSSSTSSSTSSASSATKMINGGPYYTNATKR